MRRIPVGIFHWGEEGVFLFGMDVFSSTGPMRERWILPTKGTALSLFYFIESLDLLVNESAR